MVLHSPGCGRVGRRRTSIHEEPPLWGGSSCFPNHSRATPAQRAGGRAEVLQPRACPTPPSRLQSSPVRSAADAGERCRVVDAARCGRSAASTQGTVAASAVQPGRPVTSRAMFRIRLGAWHRVGADLPPARRGHHGAGSSSWAGACGYQEARSARPRT
jgi:hypothetical protein